MIEINATPISELKEFVKWNNKFEQIEHNEETDRYLYKRTDLETGKVAYEVVKPMKNGGVLTYPNSNKFGTYGFYVSDSPIASKMIDYLMTAEDLSPEARYRYKLSIAPKKKQSTIFEF